MKSLQTIRLQEIKKSPDQTKEFSLVIDEEQGLENFPHVTFSHPISLNIKIRFEDDLYFLTGQLSAKITLECSRCLEKVSYDINYEISERYSTKPQSDEDIILIEKDEIDLIELVLEGIEFSIPKRVLCKDSCLGLCPSCGCNLNIAKCQCKDENIDPRLAILKDLLKE